MFSEVQREYIKQLVLTQHKEFPYYIAYSNTDVERIGNYDDYSFFVILSDKPINAADRYNYTIEGNCVMYAVRSSNASYTYKTERVVTQSVPKKLTINKYEFVYTNAEFSTYQVQPDLLATQNVTQTHVDGLGIAVLIILVSVIFYKMMRGRG